VNGSPPLLFALESSRTLGEDVAARLGVALGPHEEREFDGGEQKTRPLVGVRGRDVYVLASLDGEEGASANDKLCRLLFFVGALRQAGAGTVTAVCPYLCYSRKDRQTKARDPVTTRYVAQLFEAVGTDRLVTLDVHNLAAFQNASRSATEHLEATQLFVDHIVDHIVAAGGGSSGGDELVVVSPDIGGVKRAGRLRDRLTAVLGCPVGLAFTEKFRSSGVVSGREAVLGDVEGRVAIVVDDLISSGGTMARVAGALRAQGAASVTLLATHGLFTPAAAGLFIAEAVDSVVVTDSVRPRTGVAAGGTVPLVVLPVGGLLAEAIARMHGGGSLSELLHLE
jgi:ribose-phosphate pyrophosphokinase